MALLLLLPAVLSLLALCGHLLRSGMLLLIPLLFMLLPLLILSRGWVARLWQVVLILLPARGGARAAGGVLEVPVAVVVVTLV